MVPILDHSLSFPKNSHGRDNAKLCLDHQAQTACALIADATEADFDLGEGITASQRCQSVRPLLGACVD